MKPATTRDIPQSDPADLEAIQAAIRRGQPLYFVQSASGTTLDVLTDESQAIKQWHNYADRVSDGFLNVKLFKRVGTVMMPYEAPKRNAA